MRKGLFLPKKYIYHHLTRKFKVAFTCLSLFWVNFPTTRERIVLVPILEINVVISLLSTKLCISTAVQNCLSLILIGHGRSDTRDSRVSRDCNDLKLAYIVSRSGSYNSRSYTIKYKHSRSL